MKKLILIALFTIFASCLSATPKIEPTNETFNEFQVLNVICESYSEYEETIESYLNNDKIKIINRFEEERIIQIIYTDYICFGEE